MALKMKSLTQRPERGSEPVQVWNFNKEHSLDGPSSHHVRAADLACPVKCKFDSQKHKLGHANIPADRGVLVVPDLGKCPVPRNVTVQ